MYYTYILECSDGTLYAGATTDLKRRLLEHNTSKLGARYTRSRRPVRLVFSQRFQTRGKALSREAEIKKLKKLDKIRLISTRKRKRSESSII